MLLKCSKQNTVNLPPTYGPSLGLGLGLGLGLTDCMHALARMGGKLTVNFI